MKTMIPMTSADELKKLACELPAIRVVRNKLVTARRAIGGEIFIRLIESPSGELRRETVAAPKDSVGFIVTYSIEGQLSSQFELEADFLANYDPATTGERSTDSGAFIPRHARRTMYVADRPLRFLTTAGDACELQAGGVLIPTGDGFVGMNPKTFAATHSIVHSRHEARELLPSHESRSRLFQSWFEIEHADQRTPAEILDNLNRTCGTRYQHGWLSRMRHDPTRKGERIPRDVRAYMMIRVLRHELRGLGIEPGQAKIEELVERML